MLMYPKLDPVAFSLGPIKVHWYGIMYMLGFLFFVYGGKYRLKKYGHAVFTNRLIDDFIFYGAMGVVIGGRLGYCLFYQPAFFFHNTADIIKVWHGGMSFHGGMVGVFVAIYLFARKLNTTFVLSDFVAPLIPLDLFFGRMGNFINGELIGRVAGPDLPWAMIFPQTGSMIPRHPSQIYEALGEGILLTIILWVYASKPRKTGQTSGLFMLCYGCIRFFLEYFREPDPFLEHMAKTTGLSMGQWLCVPMILTGIIIYYFSTKKSEVAPVK